MKLTIVFFLRGDVRIFVINGQSVFGIGGLDNGWRSIIDRFYIFRRFQFVFIFDDFINDFL